jgi:hypothetical protein
MRPPVLLDLVPKAYEPLASRFTTVMSWDNRPPVTYEGEEYGQKGMEFERIIDLPSVVGPVFEIALGGIGAPRERIEAAGWRLVDPRRITATPTTYLEYIAGSRGEFSVAVNLEVKSRSGWFSDRTAAYLASGKPVVVQDTGFSESLPVGRGLFAFRGMDDVRRAIEAIEADYAGHCEAAREVAERYFDSDVVIGDVLARAGIPVPAAT